MAHIKKLLWITLATAALICGASPAAAQGTLPVALAQQSDVNGRPLAGALLYTFQVGTVATPQNTYSDSGLTFLNPWPLSADQSGRIPMFYMAAGSTSVRLTDRAGVVQFSYPSMLVIGASSGGGAGGVVDPSTVFSSGDVKFRPTAEVLTGWVKMNAQTIGSATSGSSGRANADTQALFIYLWTNCTDAHCPVLTGRGASGLADFNANKQLTMPDWRSRIPVGMDCMGSTCAARLTTANITSGGTDGVDTPAATGGTANRSLSQANFPNINLGFSLGGTVTVYASTVSNVPVTGASTVLNGLSVSGGGGTVNASYSVPVTGTIPLGGSGTQLDMTQPFMLGSWYMKL